jgi:hypothetical protein
VLVGTVVVGTEVVGTEVVGAPVVGAPVVGAPVVGAVFVGEVFVTGGVFFAAVVGLVDFVADEEIAAVGPRLPSGGSWLAADELADGPALADAAVWVGAVVLPWRGSAELGLLAEMRTATMATTPMAAAPMPANRTLRDPGRRGPGRPSALL